MQTDSLKISAHNLKHFSTSEATSNNSKWDHVKIEHGEFTEEDSIVTLSEEVIKRYSSDNSSSAKIIYKLDNESKRIITNIVDSTSGKVIREIPDEDTRQLSKNIGEFLKEFFSLA